MYGKFKEFLATELANIQAAGLYKNERIITTPQRADIKVNAGSDVLNFCANNYLGLSDNKRLIEAAKQAMDARGFGMSSVRFICGTQDLHKQLEAAISDYFKTEDTILYAACFDANGGLFEPLFTEEDAINKGYTVKTKEMLVATMPRAHVNDYLKGAFKIVVDAENDVILGATLYSQGAEELINLIKMAMDNNIPYTYFKNQIFTHPTMAENLNDLCNF